MVADRGLGHVMGPMEAVLVAWVRGRKGRGSVPYAASSTEKMSPVIAKI